MTADHRRADDPIVITTRDIYDELKTVALKVDQLHDGHVTRIEQASDHEARIRGLERRSYAVPAAMFMAMAALISSVFDTIARTQ